MWSCLVTASESWKEKQLGTDQHLRHSIDLLLLLGFSVAHLVPLAVSERRTDALSSDASVPSISLPIDFAAAKELTTTDDRRSKADQTRNAPGTSYYLF